MTRSFRKIRATASMSRAEFGRRRKRLMQMMGHNSIAILPGAPVRMRNRDVEYLYRPDSDFYYISGFPERDAVAVLAPGREHGEYILFCRERDSQIDRWRGRGAGLKGAVEIYGADDAFPIGDIDEILPGILESRERVYYAMGCNPDFDSQVMEWINLLRKQSRAGVHAPGEFIALDHQLHDMRLYKSSAEIKSMRRAAQISAKAHIRAMRTCRPGLSEYHLEAEIQHECNWHGARFQAYPPIVGGGDNGCVLHYTENSAPLRDGDLVLIDAGCEYDYYAADITRTLPVNGRYSEVQRRFYEVVLEAQYAAISEVRPGNHWNRPHEAAVKVLTKGLLRLGLLKGDLATLIRNDSHSKFYMHRTGHWLGMDVHDVGDYKVDGEWRMLEPGMVLTIEPGLYVPSDTKDIAKKWWGIGVRIEDDVLVTADGCEVLSRDAPKEPDEIEALMAAGQRAERGV